MFCSNGIGKILVHNGTMDTDEQFYGALTPIIALSVVDLCYSEAGICEEFCPGAQYFAHAVKAAS